MNPVAADLQSLLPDAAGWEMDAVICALGTTRAKSRSEEAYRRVDYDLPMAFARVARQRGAQAFALTSSKGASASSRFFYPRIKGELERDIQALGFASLLIARPGILGGQRAESRKFERVLLRLFGVLGPILPRGLRISRASRVAQVLIEAAMAPTPGVHIASAEMFA